MNNGRQRKNLLADDEEEVVDLELAVNKEYASRFEVGRLFACIASHLMSWIIRSRIWLAWLPASPTAHIFC